MRVEIPFPHRHGRGYLATLNGLYEGIYPEPQYALTMMDPFIYAIPSMIVLTLYCVFAWKLMPKEEGLNEKALKGGQKDGNPFPRTRNVRIRRLYHRYGPDDFK